MREHGSFCICTLPAVGTGSLAMCIFCTVSNRHLQRRPDFILAFLPIVSYNGMENKETADHSGMTVLRILTVPVLPSDKGCRQVPGLYTERGRGNLYRSEKSPWPGAVRLPVCWSQMPGMMPAAGTVLYFEGRKMNWLH